MRFERFVDGLTMGFAFDGDFHVQAVILRILTGAGKVDGKGTVANDFANRGFHFLLISSDDFINPDAGIIQIQFFFCHNVHMIKNTGVEIIR